MKKTLYIPTSSMNFNNILSSESISPCCFYSEREFGFKSVVDIFEGEYPNIIIASDQQCAFKRPPSDVEDHPMLVQVSINENECAQMGNGFYGIDHTIYITPCNSHFFFFSELDKQRALTFAEYSLEVKMQKIYQSRISIISPSSDYDFSEIHNDKKKGGRIDINKDDRINRLKGMLYGYYLGAALSTSKTNIIRLNILRDIYEEFSAVINHKEIDSSLNERMINYSLKWMQTFPLFVELQKVCPDNRTLFRIIDVIEKKGILLGIDRIELKPHLEDLVHSIAQGNANPSMKWIESMILRQKERMQQESNVAMTENKEILIDGSLLTSIKLENNSDLVLYWFNNILLLPTTPTIKKHNQFEVADIVTDGTKEYFKENWESSQERAFLNKLRRHIKGERFDVTWDNNELSSLASVILHGYDWMEMLEFMQSQGLYDYRLAFAIYGALTGYSNMGKDLVDMMFERDKTYGKSVYKEIFFQLFRQNVENIMEDTPAANELCMKIVEEIKNHKSYKKDKHEKYCEMIIQQNISDFEEIRKIARWKGLIDDVERRMKKKNILQEHTLFS